MNEEIIEEVAVATEETNNEPHRAMMDEIVEGPVIAVGKAAGVYRPEAIWYRYHLRT